MSTDPPKPRDAKRIRRHEKRHNRRAGNCPGPNCVIGEKALAVEGCPGPKCVIDPPDDLVAQLTMRRPWHRIEFSILFIVLLFVLRILYGRWRKRQDAFARVELYKDVTRSWDSYKFTKSTGMENPFYKPPPAADEIESVVAEATPPPKRATPSSAPKAASSGRGSGQARWQYSRDAIDDFASTQALINAELSPDDDDDDDELESGRSGSRT